MAYPDDSDLSGLFGPSYVNQNVLDRASSRVSGALTSAREARERARAAFGVNAQETVKAIDDTTAELRKAHEAQWNLPALAFGAGMLRTTPGVQSNFLSEVGSGLNAAVPVIAQQRMSDRDFWSRIADLTAKRGEIAGEPSKIDLAQATKEIDELTRNQTQLEAAGIRGVPVELRREDARLKQQQQIQAKRQEMLTKIQSESRKDVDEMLKSYEGIQPEDRDALVQYVMHDRVQKYNMQPEQDVKMAVPELTPDQIERANKIRSNLQKKGIDEYRAKLRAEIVKNAESAIKMQYPAFASLDPDAQEAIRQKHIARLIDENNKSTTRGQEPYMEPQIASPEDWAKINAAEAAHRRLITMGSPGDDEIASNHLPVDMKPKAYEGLSYGDRSKKLAREEEKAKKEMEPIVAAAQELPQRLLKADEFMSSYDASSRTGWKAGWLPSTGSDVAQQVDKVAADLAMTNVPKGQGAISDAERAIIAKANPSRLMERGAAQTLVNFYKEASMRANEQLQFFRAWENTHRTVDGAMEAWNKYISSPQGMIVREGKGGTMEINPRRMSWREYFDRQNKGEPLETTPSESWVRDPKTGKLVRKTAE